MIHLKLFSEIYLYCMTENMYNNIGRFKDYTKAIRPKYDQKTRFYLVLTVKLHI